MIICLNYKPLVLLLTVELNMIPAGPHGLFRAAVWICFAITIQTESFAAC